VPLAPLRAYHAPTTLRECLDVLRAESGRVLVLAGGQSALPLLKSRQLRPEVLLDLAGVEELRGVSTPADGEGLLELGSMMRYREILEAAPIGASWTALWDAATTLGDVQVRNRGTIGGNVAFADVAADIPPVAVCLSAELVVAGQDGERTVSAEEFFSGPRQTTLRPDELLAALRFPAPGARSGSGYIKYGITANGRPVIGVAASISLDEDGGCVDARVAVGGVLPAPRRARNAEQALIGTRLDVDVLAAAARAAADEVPTQDDLRASAAYRRQLIKVYGERALQRAAERARKGQVA
jgi:carbon-monoxide dehydrogenase medium subunit